LLLSAVQDLASLMFARSLAKLLQIHHIRAILAAFLSVLQVHLLLIALQDLANPMFALSIWQRPISQPSLQRCLAALRSHWGSAGCHVPTLIHLVSAHTPFTLPQAFTKEVAAA
jgi:hypothetical protein